MMKNAQWQDGTTSLDREIVLTRTFDAPRALVFDAWTKPEHVRHWWDPSRRPLAVCEIDLRPNGTFRFVNADPEHSAHPFEGVYREIVPPERIVFITRVGPMGLESTGTIRLMEKQGRTTLTVSIACHTAADLQSLRQMGVEAGTQHTLDNLVQYVGTLA